MEEKITQILKGPLLLGLTIIFFFQVANSSTTGLVMSYFTTEPKLKQCDQKYKIKDGLCDLEKMCKDGIKIEFPKTELLNWNIQYKLYCKKNFYERNFHMIAKTLHLGASGIFPLFMNFLPDKIGRFKTLLIEMIITLVSHVFMLIPNQVCSLIGMFLNGGIIQMYSLICQIVTECYVKDIRGVVFGIYMASIGTIDLMFVFLFKYAHSIYYPFLFNIVSQIISIVAYLIFYMESPIWLISQNKTADCVKVLEKAAKFNKKQQELEELKPDIEKYVQEKLEVDENKKTNYIMCDICKYPSIRKYVFLLGPMWIVIVCFDFVIFLFVDRVSGDIYAGGFTTCIAVLTSAFSTGFIVDIIGRKTGIIIYSFMSFISFALNPLMKKWNRWPEVIFIFITGFGVESAFTCVILITGEIFPTTIKGVANGTTYLIGRIGAIASPFVLDKLPYPQYIMSGVTALVTILMFMLKETKGYQSPEDVEEVSNTKLISDKEDAIVPEDDGRSSEPLKSDV